MPDYETLDIERIETARKNTVIGKKIVLFKSTASTNDIAWKYAANPSYHGLCVLAESQRKGRGRRGRIWHSSPGQSILCSILLLNQSLEAELLTLTAAVATAEAVLTFCKRPCRIKWPNDILLNGKKLAGILVEKKTVKKQHQFVVGIGVNCNQPAEFFQEHRLRMPATSLATETGQTIDRTALVCELLGQFEQWFDKAAQSSPPDEGQKLSPCKGGVPRRGEGVEAGRGYHTENPVIARWQQLSDLLGRHITVESDNHTYSGFCRGIDPAEGLIVQLDAGPIRFFNAAQTTLLKT